MSNAVRSVVAAALLGVVARAHAQQAAPDPTAAVVSPPQQDI